MSLVRNTLVQASLTLVSRCLGLLREAIIAAKIGAGPVGDAFFAALMFPNLFRRFFAEGAFAQAFVPTYARTLEAEGEAAAAAVAQEALKVLFAVTAALTIAAQIGMPWIITLLMGAYGDQPDIVRLAVVLTQITMPYLTFMALSALFSGVLNAAGRFAFSAGAPTLLNVFIIGAVMSTDGPIETAHAAAYAVAAAGVAQALLLWWGVRRQKVSLSLIGWPRITPNVRRVMALAVPGAIAASGMQINVLVSQILAGFEVGARSALQYADRLYQLPLGLVGVAVGVAILPRLARSARAEDPVSANKMMDDGVGLALALTLPAAVALLLVPSQLIDAILGRGAFTSDDVAASAGALIHFAWGVPAFVLIKVLAPGFFAREDTRTPMRFALLSVVVNTAIGAGLFVWLRSQGLPGFPGLAIATSAAAWVNAALLFVTLNRRGWYRPGRRLLVRLISVSFASAAMGGGLIAARIYEPELRQFVPGGPIVDILVLIAAGALVYGIAAVLFGAIRPSDLKALASQRTAE